LGFGSVVGSPRFHTIRATTRLIGPLVLVVDEWLHPRAADGGLLPRDDERSLG
jgi:hypothetical protein